MDRFMTKFLEILQVDVQKSFYGRYHILTLRLMGLWPYESYMWRAIPLFLTEILLISGIIPIVVYLIEVLDHNYYSALQSLLVAVPLGAFTVIYFVIHLDFSKYTILHLELSRVWQILADEDERRYILDYFRWGHLISFGFSVCMSILWLSITMFVGVTLFTTDSATSYSILIPGDYIFFEPQNHPYIILCHWSVILGTICMVSSEVCSIFIISAEQINGFFCLVSRRLSCIVSFDEDTNEPQKNHKGYVRPRYLKDTVELHCQSIRLCESVEAVYHRSVLCAELMTLTLLPLLYFYVLKCHSSIVEKYLAAGAAVSLYVYLIFLNSIGQRIIDCSDRVLGSIYFSDWYLAPPVERKLLQIIMIKSQNTTYLTAGKFAPLSLDSFGKIVKLSYSYFASFASISSVINTES